MTVLTLLTILLPLAGFLVLALAGGRLGRRAVVAVGTGSVGLAAVASVAATAWLAAAGSADAAHTAVLWRWIEAGSFRAEIALRLDALSSVMLLVVTGVGFLIHVYSAGFLDRDEAAGRFFAYMNLFVASMATLVLADDLVLLYLGWEGVGLCSYLLIGFWYREPANGRAARKAFVVTRIGDAAMAVGLFILFDRLGTLRIGGVLAGAPGLETAAATAAAFCLLGGAVGKSAQLPLQTWLPDAMAGPTPVSALIHAATMVTAGVYLVARTHALFVAAPAALAATAVVGTVTLLVGASSALAQRDIKRVLAYSTMSQVGYMFLALGVGAWSGAIFHFFTHAFFKALLFLAAGAVILAQSHEHDIHRMGGLRRELPVVFWTFLAGAASLAALPVVTAGSYSKELILESAWSAGDGGPWFWAAGLLGSLLTALYAGRLVALVFLGESKTPVGHRPGALLLVPLVVLAVPAVVAGWLETPAVLGGVRVVSSWLEGVLPAAAHPAAHGGAAALRELAGALVPLAGLGLAAYLFVLRPARREALLRPRAARAALRATAAGWGFDRLYGALVVRPFTALARALRSDPVDVPYLGTAAACLRLHRRLAATQTGRVRWYATVLALGAAAGLAVVVFR